MRIWGKILKENHLLRDTVIEDYEPDTRTHKIMRALEMIAEEFDLPVPIWLDANIEEFRKIARTQFRADSFVESVDFDYLEIQIIEEDDEYA